MIPERDYSLPNIHFNFIKEIKNAQPKDQDFSKEHLTAYIVDE